MPISITLHPPQNLGSVLLEEVKQWTQKARMLPQIVNAFLTGVCLQFQTC
jgi:hypothetical protein